MARSVEHKVREGLWQGQKKVSDWVSGRQGQGKACGKVKIRSVTRIVEHTVRERSVARSVEYKVREGLW